MKSYLLSEQSSVFRAADPHLVSDYVNQHVGQHCIGSRRQRHTSASLTHRKFAALDLCQISYGSTVRVTSAALENIYHLQILLSGHCLWHSRTQQVYLQPGDLLLINPDDPVDLTYSADCEKFILKVPVSLLDSICDEHRWQRPQQGIRFKRNHYRLHDLQGLSHLLSMICHEAELMDSLPRVQSSYNHIVGAKLLSLLSTNICHDSQNNPHHAVQRLIDYIDQNLKQELSNDALAQYLNISQRSLYALFDNQLGSTPRQFIRQRKLERIHTCLSDPNCTVRNLTELALDYGFTHLGRFSDSYRQQFGELPSETLKRRNTLLLNP